MSTTRVERILKARRMAATGWFDRAVSSIEPSDLYSDTMTLECGHTITWGVWSKRHYDPLPFPAAELCEECAEAWIASDDEKG